MKLTLAGQEMEVAAASVRDERTLVAIVDGREEEWPLRRRGDSMDVQVGGAWQRFVVRRCGEEVWVAAEAELLHFQKESEGVAARGETGSLSSPMPGRVLEVRVAPGDLVERGDVLAMVEAMKVEMRIVAPKDGKVVEVAYQAGEQIEAGIPLVVLE